MRDVATEVSQERPVTRYTSALAQFYASDLAGGRCIWRNALLEQHLEECDRERKEFAKYRCDCWKEAGKASRWRAKKWRSRSVPKHFPTPPPDGPVEKPVRSRFCIDTDCHDSPCGAEQQGDEAGEKSSSPSCTPSKRVRIQQPIKHKVIGRRSPRELVVALTPAANSRGGLGAILEEGAPQPPKTPRTPSGFVSIQDSTSQNGDGAERSQRTPKRPVALFADRQSAKQAALDEESQARRRLAVGRHMRRAKAELRKRRPSGVLQTNAKFWPFLPEEEKEAMRAAFLQQAGDMSGSLTAAGLQQTLMQMGFSCKAHHQKAEILAMCSEAAEIGETDFQHFCFVLVPQVRSWLISDARKHLREVFCRSASSDTAGLEECQAIMEAQFSSLLGPDARATLRKCFIEEVRNDLHMREMLEQDPRGRTLSTPPMPEWEKMPTVQRLPFEKFEVICQRTLEKYERLNKDLSERIQNEANLDPTLVEGMEADILPFLSRFRAYSNTDGSISFDDLRHVLLDSGILTGKRTEDAPVLSQLAAAEAEGGPVRFDRLLRIVRSARLVLKLLQSSQTAAQFARRDKDHSGGLSVVEVRSLFAEMGMAPEHTDDQREIVQILHAADTDGNGDLNLAEFQQLVQLCRERLHALARVREAELGRELQFTGSQIREYRDAFWELDEQGTGRVGLLELRRAIKLMGHRIDGDTLRLLFARFDPEGTGQMEFPQFMQFMHAIDRIPQ